MKKYVKPALEVYVLETEDFIAQSPTSVGYDESKSGGDQLSPYKRSRDWNE